MFEMDLQTDLLETYFTTANDLLPPGFVLEGKSIVHAIGDVRQLFSSDLPDPLSNVHQLPVGDVKSRLLQIVNFAEQGVPIDQCVAPGVRVKLISKGDGKTPNTILVVFDVSLLSDSAIQCQPQETEVETALKTNQRMLHHLLDNSPLMIAYVDCDLKYLYVNGNYADFWQVEREQIIGKRVPELTGDFFETLEPYLERTLLGETAFHLELVAPSESPLESKWLEITHVPAFDANESVIGFYCFVNDVTESQKNERLLQMILSHAPAMILLLNTKLDILHANLQFTQRLVASDAGVVSSQLADILGNETFIKLADQINSALAGKKSSCEAQLQSVDGDTIDVIANFVPEFDDENNVVGICGLMLDISELKNVKSELQRSEARFEVAVSGSSLGVIEFDPKKPDWVFADHIENILGFDRGELKSSRAVIRELIHPDDLAKNKASNSFVPQTENTRLELRLKNKTGEYRWYDVCQHSSRHESVSGKLVGTIIDIDNLKSAELKSAAQVRQRDEFLAMLSHELRSPMAAIVLSLDLLKESNSNPSDSSAVIDIIIRQTKQISRLLDDLLDVSRVTHNRIEFKKEVHDVNRSVKEVVESFLTSAKHKNQTLHVDTCSQNLFVDGDESRLRQVVTNLLENAIKYTPEAGEIRVSTRQSDGNAIISVCDSGLGIAPELIANVFELFVQGETTIHRSSGGMGVGLFMVNHIVNAHDGTILVSSDGPGLGSQFDVYLPLSFEAPPIQDTNNANSTVRRSVVIVEDNLDARKMASWLLEQRGFSVTQFADGESASHAVPEICPDIAIIDIGLPGKSGLDLAREFRQLRSLDDTLLIALTGYGQESDRERVVDAGFDIHLVKPTSINDLTGAIVNWKSNERSVQV